MIVAHPPGHHTASEGILLHRLSYCPSVARRVKGLSHCAICSYFASRHRFDESIDPLLVICAAAVLVCCAACTSCPLWLDDLWHAPGLVATPLRPRSDILCAPQQVWGKGFAFDSRDPQLPQKAPRIKHPDKAPEYSALIKHLHLLAHCLLHWVGQHTNTALLWFAQCHTSVSVLRAHFTAVCGVPCSQRAQRTNEAKRAPPHRAG